MGQRHCRVGIWQLDFIRHLPKVTPEEIAEMEKLNPKSSEEWQQMQAEESFLEGNESAAPAAAENHAHHH